MSGGVSRRLAKKASYGNFGKIKKKTVTEWFSKSIAVEILEAIFEQIFQKVQKRYTKGLP